MNIKMQRNAKIMTNLIHFNQINNTFHPYPYTKQIHLECSTPSIKLQVKYQHYHWERLDHRDDIHFLVYCSTVHTHKKVKTHKNGKISSKMPFIWDDNRYFLVDDEEKYDKKRFVIARKLFVKPKDDKSMQEQPFSHEFLDRNLRKFGKIESIEILPTGKCEAYVTFENDRNAYLAVAHNELERKSSSHIINIQPADTWVQPQSICADEIPTTNQMDIENMSDFFRLNEDCILELTKYLDLESLVNLSNVCKLLHRLLHQYCFPRYRVYSIRNGSSVPIPLAKVRRTLMCIGPYITELNFRWHDLDFNNRLQRFLDKMGQYVGQNIRVVRFHCLLIDDQCILAIKNILQRLDTLELLVNNQGFELDLDFIEVCPNLRKLKLLENNRLVRCCKPWPQLKHLSMIGNGRFILPKFRLLLEHNPQLTCLKFTARHADDRLQAITQHLPNLQKLTILSSNPDISATNIVSLSSLQHLTTLNLMYLDEDELDGILECLTHFTGLRVLKLHLSFNGKDKDGHFEPNQAAMISLAQDLPHLEKFCTRYIKWEESTLINFIRFASQLQAMHIHWCDLPITNLRLVKIVKVLRRNRPQPQSKPLQLFVNPTVNRRAITGFDVINDQNYTQYLNVRTKCRHLQKGLF